MEKLKEKLLEAINNANNYNSVGDLKDEELAIKCAEISLNYGRMQRLEGMIDVYRQWKKDDDYYDYPPMRIKKLTKQLEELKQNTWK